jgi:hypothetical protein
MVATIALSDISADRVRRFYQLTADCVSGKGIPGHYFVPDLICEFFTQVVDP